MVSFDLNGWLAGQVICKLFVYFGAAVASGGMFCLWLTPSAQSLISVVKKYFLVAILLALLASILGFFLKVGYLAESGIGGMFDRLYMTILWGSSVGSSTAWQIGGFSLLLLGCFCLIGDTHLSNNRTKGRWFTYLISMLFGLGSVIVVSSIAIVGHAASIDLVAQIGIGLHVFAGLWWLGSLVPLQLACSRLSVQPLQQLMHRFSQVAVGIVLLLMVSGGWVAWQLFASLTELFTTNYGRIFLIKICLVIGLLSLALWHKARLVPRLLQSPKTAEQLMHSIRIETVIGMALLIATAILTTVVGPSHV